MAAGSVIASAEGVHVGAVLNRRAEGGFGRGARPARTRGDCRGPVAPGATACGAADPNAPVAATGPWAILPEPRYFR